MQANFTITNNHSSGVKWCSIPAQEATPSLPKKVESEGLKVGVRDGRHVERFTFIQETNSLCPVIGLQLMEMFLLTLAAIFL